MGGGGKGGSSVSSVQIPPEVLARYNAVNARAETVAQQPYQAYSQDPNAFVAPLTATQQAGIQNTNAMAGAAQPYYGAATQQLNQAQQTGQNYLGSATNQLMNAQQQAQPYLGAATGAAYAGGQAITPGQLQTQQYMNPYVQNVVEATQAAMGQQQGQQLAQQQAEAIRSGAFGGDRSGAQRSLLRGQQALAQSQAISPLYQQAYNQALQTAQQQQGVGLGAAQANRAAQAAMGQQLAGLGQQQFGMGSAVSQGLAGLGQQGYGMGAGTSQALANLGSGAQAAGLAGAQAQMGAGATEQQTQQAGLQAMYNQFMQKQGYPFQIAQFLANIAEGTGALSGNTTSTTMASDRRLKENVQKVGETNDGQPIYRYNFKGDPRTQIGLMAQEVEKDHPEAVDDSHGYKSVDYKKATEDAIHKDDGGEVSGMERYSMAAPSEMLQKSGGLGALTLPQMVTGRDIPIKPGANMAEIAAMRAPQATGVSPGSVEAAKAQYASLGGVSPQSGEGYKDYEMKRLSDFLAQHGAEVPSYASSQGGLVGAEGGAFARGGYANDGYVNPALQFYGPQGAKGGFDSSGPYGATLSPAQARQLLQGTKPPEDRRPSGVQQAKDIGSLGVMAGGAWKDRPDFMRSDEDLAKIAEAQKVSDAKDFMTLKQAEGLGFGKSHGGMIEGRHHYADMGYVNPGSGPYGTEEAKQQRFELLKPNERRQIPQDQGGLGPAMQIASLGKTGYDLANSKGVKGAADWVGSKLGADAAGEAASKGVIDLTTKVPGLGAAAPEALSAAVPEAAAAAVPEVLAGAGETAALAAPELMAAAEIPEWLLLAGLPFGVKRGGAIPRNHYANGSLVPPRADPLTGPDTGEAMSEEDMALLKDLALKTTVPQNAPKLERAAKPAEAPTEAPAKPAARPAVGEVGAGRAPYSHFMSQLFPDSVKPETKAALTSENLWAPALAGIGAAMASRAPTRGQAIGEGLVGATTAYTGLQKQQSGTDLAAAQAGLAKAQTSRARVLIDPATNTRVLFYADPKTGQERMIRLTDALDMMEKGETFGLEPADLDRLQTAAAAAKEKPAAVPKATAAPSTTQAEKPPAAGGPAPPPTPPAEVKKPETSAPKITEAAAPDKAASPASSPGALNEEDAKKAEEFRKESRDKPASWFEANKDIYTDQQAAAKGSSEFRSQFQPMAAALSAAPRSGPLAAGPLRDVFVPLAKYLDNIGKAVGFQGGPFDEGKIADAEEGRKYVQRLREAAAAKGNFQAVSALSAIEKGYPSDTNTAKGIAKLLAGMSVETQRDIDKNEYFQNFKQKAESGIKDAIAANKSGAWADLHARFDKTRDPVYQKEKAILERMYGDAITSTKDGKKVYLGRNNEIISKEDFDAGRGQPMTVAEWVMRGGSDVNSAQKKWVATHYGPRMLRYFGMGE